MANNDNPKGFAPRKYLDGAAYDGKVFKYFVPASDGTAIYKGGPVKLAGSADDRGIPTVTAASSGDKVVGVMVGKAEATRDDTLYREASTDTYILCSPVDNLLYEVQEDSDTSTLAATNVGNNISHTAESGDTIYGNSTIELDSSTAATTNTLALQIVSLADRTDNEIGDYAKWLVRFNDVQYSNQITGV